MAKGKEIVVAKSGNGLQNEEWYVQLVEDCRAIKVERSYNAAIEIIQGNWELGKRISEENDNMERAKVYGKKIIETLAEDIGKSPTHLWKCVQVYQFYGTDDFDTLVTKLPEGKNVTWTRAIAGAGIQTEKGALKEKTSFKLDDIIASFKIWLVSRGTVEDDDIQKAISEFREELQKHNK